MIFLFGLLFFSFSFLTADVVSAQHKDFDFFHAMYDSILSLPNDDIDLATACLLLSKQAFPNLDVSEYDSRVNAMVERIDYFYQNQPITLAEQRIALMNTYLFKPG